MPTSNSRQETLRRREDVSSPSSSHVNNLPSSSSFNAYISSLLPSSIRPFVALSYPIDVTKDDDDEEPSSSSSSQAAAARQIGQDPKYTLVTVNGGDDRDQDSAAGSSSHMSTSDGVQRLVVDRYPQGREAGWLPERCTFVETSATVPLSAWTSSSSSLLPPPRVTPSQDSLVTSASILYGKGPHDALLALFWAIAFTVLREVVMRGVYAPGWKWWVGRRRKQRERERRACEEQQHNEKKKRRSSASEGAPPVTSATKSNGARKSGRQQQQQQQKAVGGATSGAVDEKTTTANGSGKLRKRRRGAAAATTAAVTSSKDSKQQQHHEDNSTATVLTDLSASASASDSLRPPRLASRLSTEELDSRASPPPSSTSSTSSSRSSSSSVSSDDGGSVAVVVASSPVKEDAVPQANVPSAAAATVIEGDDEKALLLRQRHRHHHHHSSSAAVTEARLARKERARKAAQRTVTRFAEQGWTFTYASVSWSTGMYILSHARTFPLSSEYMWSGYPHTPLPALTKLYYLAQLGFWLHQLVILNVEARRKDHWQMLTHHVVTIALVVASYWMNFTRVGTVILALMDFCDILLPLAKMFRYLSLPTLTDATFVLFLLSWLITRQVGFLLVFLSVCFKSTDHMPLVWAPEHEFYLSSRIVAGFGTLLGGLQVMNAIWFYMACKVAYRVVRGLGAEDTRSDDEGDMDDAANDDDKDMSDVEVEDDEKHQQSYQPAAARESDERIEAGQRSSTKLVDTKKSVAPPSMRTRAKVDMR